MRGRLIIAAACCAGVAAALTPVAQATSPGAALTVSAPPAPTTHETTPATLTAEPVRPRVGQPVRLVLAAPPGARDFAWDLDGRGAFARHTGEAAQTETTFTTSGRHAVAVRFGANGQTQRAALTLTVAPRPAPPPPPAPRARHWTQARTHHAVATGLTGRVTAHVAGDPGVTVADFHFSPATTTIHVGDTITWTNDGPSSHTATAHGGAFDTGVLKKGQSASHTFSHPGTFTYFCQIHPFMHGTIVVLASTTSTSATSTHTSAATTPTTTTPAATTTTPTATTAAAPSGPTLPNTGFDVLADLGAGVLLLGLGIGLRRGARWQRLWGRPLRASGRPR